MVEANEKSWKENLRGSAHRILKATIITVFLGIFLLVLWVFVVQLFKDYPEYQKLYAILAWAIVFFTFATKVTEETIYKFVLIIARALFLIIYFIYATNGGVFTINFMDMRLTIEFVSILALMVLVNFLEMVRGVLQAIEFTSASPKD